MTFYFLTIVNLLTGRKCTWVSLIWNYFSMFDSCCQCSKMGLQRGHITQTVCNMTKIEHSTCDTTFLVSVWVIHSFCLLGVSIYACPRMCIPRQRWNTVSLNTRGKTWGSDDTIEVFDWCCFYNFVRNSLVALLEAMCSNLCLRFVNIGFSCLFFSCLRRCFYDRFRQKLKKPRTLIHMNFWGM